MMEERKDGVHVSQLFGNKNLNRAKTIHPPKQEEPKSEQVEEKQELNTEKQKKEPKKTEEQKPASKKSEEKEEKAATPQKKEEKTVEKKSEKAKETDHRLIFGFNDKKKPLYIPESSRYFNSLVLGLKGTGKTTGILPFFVEQDLQNKKAGITILVSSQEMSYTLYTLAKQYKRKIIFLKPSIHNEVANQLLFKEEYDYDYIDTNILCYKEAIKNKSVIIIDMEHLKYKSEARKVCAMLLLQLQLDMQETDLTGRTAHFVYIDDAWLYAPFIRYLLQCGSEFHIGVTLFANSLSQFGEYQGLLENTIRNYFLCSVLSVSDMEYFAKRFQDENIWNVRSTQSIFYEVVDHFYNRRTGTASYKRKSEEEWTDLEKKSKKYRMKLLKEKRLQQEMERREDLKDIMGTKSVKGEPIPIDASILEESEQEDFTTLNEEEQAREEERIHEEVRQQIVEEEKNQRRELATKSFNNMNQHIDYCSDDFDFHF